MSKKKALSLLEVLLSLAILGLVLVASIPLLTLGAKGIMTGGEKSKEIYLRQKTLEEHLTDPLYTPETLPNTIITFSDGQTILIQNIVLYQEEDLFFLTTTP